MYVSMFTKAKETDFFMQISQKHGQECTKMYSSTLYNRHMRAPEITNQANRLDEEKETLKLEKSQSVNG